MKSKQKLLKLLEALKLEYISIADFLKEHNSTQQVRLFRHQVQGVIGNALDLTGRHSISIWINRLLVMNVLRLNPDSSTVNGKYMPNSDTKYYLNLEAINAELAKNRQDTPTRLTQF